MSGFSRRAAHLDRSLSSFFSSLVSKSIKLFLSLARPNTALKFLAIISMVLIFAGIRANAYTQTIAVGTTAGNFSVDTSGAAVYTVPLIAAPGTNGMQPNLSLVYSSQGGNGLLGMGWSLGGLSVIHRCGATIELDGFKGGVNYDGNDKFCLDGERLIKISSTEYRTYRESLQRVIASDATTNPAWFTVTDKTGVTREYATTIETAGNANIRRLWVLSKVRDPHGNYFTISYDKTDVSASGDYRPLSISYTANDGAGLTADNSIVFTYANRSDVTAIYEGGYVIRSLKRLNKVTSYTGATKVREYQLGYANVGATGYSRLTSLQECGTDGTCLTATTFGWLAGTDGFNPNVVTTDVDGSGWGASYYPRQFADINGDGRTDLVLVENSEAIAYVFLAKADGSFETQPVVTDVAGSGWGVSYFARYFADINGDGRTDFVLVENSEAVAYVFLAKADGSFETQPVTTDVAGSGWSVNYFHRDLVDVNGDGRIDLVLTENSEAIAYVFLATGNGSFSVNPITTDVAGSGWTESSYARHLVDINGDGNADLVLVNKSEAEIYVFLSLGNGSFASNPLSTDPAGSGWSIGNFPRQFVDVNGDGRLDFVLIDNSEAIAYVFLAKGDGTFASTPVTTDVDGSGWQASNFPRHLVDVNGDGRTDLVLIDNAEAVAYTFISKGDGTFASAPTTTDIAGSGWSNASFKRYFADTNGDGKQDLVLISDSEVILYVASATFPRDLVTSITNGLGAVTSVNYASIAQDIVVYTKETQSEYIWGYPYRAVPPPFNVVSSFSSSNGIGGSNTTTYRYGSFKSHQTAGISLGFRWVQSTDPAGLISVIYHNQYRENKRDGTIAVQETYAGSTRIKYIANTWNRMNNVCGGTDQVQLETIYEETRELNNAVVSTVNMSTTYDSCGFPLTNVVDNNDGWKKTVSNTYTHDTTNWRLGLVTQAQVTAEATGFSSQTRTSTFTYNSDGSMAGEVLEPSNSSLALTTSYTYDSFGNRTGKTISGSNIVTRSESQTYDAQGRFVVSRTNALGQTTTFTHDPRSGQPFSQTDVNGLTTSWDYDGLGRKGLETRPNGTVSTITYSPTIQGGVLTGYSTDVQSAGAARIYTFFDILGREVRSSTNGFSGAWIYRDKGYDALGRVISVSNPDFNSTPSYHTISTYDILGRVTSVTTPGSGNRTTTKTYNGLVTTTTNPLSQVITETKNSQGKTVQVTDAAGTTSYIYDPFVNLTKVTDALGNATTMSYDLRGRKTAMHDPDLGDWSYSYNVLNELVSQTDAKSQTTTMAYDKLGRLTSRTNAEGTSTWTYDTATKGIGKLASLVGPGGYQEIYTYDTLSRISQVTKTIGGTSYSVVTDYDSYGRLDTTTYPSTGYKVKQVYDSYGYLWQVKRIQPNGAQSLLWQTYTADAHSHVTQEVFGNGVTSQRTYDQAAVDLLTIQTGIGGSTQNIQNLSYTSDALHNLTARNDGITSLNETFSYDGLNRLTTATGAVTKNYQYDAIGNITSKTGVGTYAYNASGINSVRPHAVTATSGTLNNSYTYDANGNMTGGAGRTIAYTSFNKPSQITGSSTTSITYDPNYNRVQKVTGTQTNIYIGKLYEKVTTGSLVEHKHYIYGGKSLVAIYTERNNSTNDTKYIHTNHLDSIDVVTDDNGNVVERLSFDPHGRRRQTNGQDATGTITSSVNRGFARHEHDDEVSLINMNARLYDPTLGRFITPDSLVEGPAGQGLNRYSYVVNNPLSRIDPTGHRSLRSLVRAVVGVAIAVYAPMYYGAYNAAVAKSQGASWGAAFKAGVIADLSISAFKLVGDGTQGWNVAAKGIAHGITGGVIGELQGGSFKSGFLSASIPAWSSPAFVGLGPTGEGVARAMIGGIAARSGGGDFFAGMTTAAVAYIFNDLAHRYELKTHLCDMGQTGCTLSNALGVSDKHSVAFLLGGKAPVEGRNVLWGNNPIQHVVDRENFSITNITLEGHDFHPGEVKHQLTVDQRPVVSIFGATFKSVPAIYLTTTGMGTGPNPNWNNFVGRAVFNTMHQNVRGEMQNQAHGW